MPMPVHLSASFSLKNRLFANFLDLEGTTRMLVVLQRKDEQWHSKPFTVVDPCAALSSRWLLSRCSSWVLPSWATTQGQAAPCKRKSHRSQRSNSTTLGGRALSRAAVTSVYSDHFSEETARMGRIAEVSFGTYSLGFSESRARLIAMRIRRFVAVNAPVLAAFIKRKNTRSEHQDDQKIHHCLHTQTVTLPVPFFKVGAAAC